MITREDLENWFTYHAPTSEQAEVYARIRGAALNFAIVIIEATPPSADQTAAIRNCVSV